MPNLASIGTPPWSRSELIDHLDEFESVYADRPVRDNQGGMKAPHMFAVWFMARRLDPDLIVESGIWKGQSTWLLEKACPRARLVSIDLNLANREYISDRATYSDRDFVEQDWVDVSDRALVFFDDHQNAYRRLQQCKWFGFRNIIFDDNYPTSRGDCYSLKKAFSGAGFEPDNFPRRKPGVGVFFRILRASARLAGREPVALIPQHEPARVRPNDIDSRMLRKNLDVYYEFPPVIKTSMTRWGDAWESGSYPTPEPLLERSDEPERELFVEEAGSYTWVCYARLK